MHARILIGTAFGRTSPVETFAETLYVDVAASVGSSLTLRADSAMPTLERAVYSVDRAITVDGAEVPAFTLAILAPGADSTIDAPQGARYVVIGGAPLDGPRVIWWNFVSSQSERIEAAKAQWSQQRMGQIPGEHEWIPLP